MKKGLWLGLALGLWASLAQAQEITGPTVQNLGIGGYGRYVQYVLGCKTTGATAIEATTDGSCTPTASNTIVFANNSSFAFNVIVTAYDETTGGANSQSYLTARCAAARGANAASTTVSCTFQGIGIGSPPAPAAAATAVADTTLGGLNISITPPTSNTHSYAFFVFVYGILVQ